jgi:hypothetical protein
MRFSSSRKWWEFFTTPNFANDLSILVCVLRLSTLYCPLHSSIVSDVLAFIHSSIMGDNGITASTFVSFRITRDESGMDFASTCEILDNTPRFELKKQYIQILTSTPKSPPLW